jgi:hypothetical protein
MIDYVMQSEPFHNETEKETCKSLRARSDPGLFVSASRDRHRLDHCFVHVVGPVTVVGAGFGTGTGEPVIVQALLFV